MKISQLFHPPQVDGEDAGSSPFILDCAELVNRDVVSVGEDGSVVVWRDDRMMQSLMHPSCTWCVVPLKNGDFATGCVRLLTT